MKGFLSVIVFIALVAFALGASVSGAALVAVSPKPSQEVVDQIEKEKAKEEAETKAAWRETWTGVARVFEYGIAGTFLSGIAIAGTVVVGRWIKRHDRALDENGHAPLVKKGANLTNPNLTGALTDEPVDPRVALELARLRAQVDIARAMFAGGINGRMAGGSQRDVLPKWNGEIEIPQDTSAPGADHPDFWLTDDRAKTPALAGSPAPAVAFSQTKEAILW